MPILQVTQGPNRGSFYYLESHSNILGRDPKCQVVLYDTCASRQHTEIVKKGRDHILKDLQSTNGTMLNGLPVTTTPFKLEEGDRIKIGNTELLFLEREPREDFETEVLDRDGSEPHWFHDSPEMMVLGQTPQMKEIASQVFKAAPMDIPVLITGESGTGKELIARLIHRNSKRRKASFHAINCATIGSLAESELFGHEKGAFTGAVAQRQGIFEVANRGTLFLDEVGDAPLEIQVKLLRVLETGTFYRIGGSVLIETDIRIIAATNQDLKQKMRNGGFREDLYYRLQGIEIGLPPIRERVADIRVLVEHFLKIFNQTTSHPAKNFSDEAIKAIEKYPFPGNVRELKNLIERILILRSHKNNPIIEKEEVEPFLKDTEGGSTEQTKKFVMGGSLQDIEKNYIKHVFEETNGNKSEAARVLGIDRATLYAKIKKYKIEKK